MSTNKDMQAILSHQMKPLEKLLSVVADTILSAYNRSKTPRIYVPTDFRGPVERGGFQTIVMDGNYVLVTMNGLGIMQNVTPIVSGLNAYLGCVDTTFYGKGLKGLDDFIMVSAVREAVKKISFMGLDFSLWINCKEFFNDGPCVVYVSDKAEETTTLKTLAELKLSMFGDGKKTYYFMEV